MRINNHSLRLNIMLKIGLFMSLAFFPFYNGLFYIGFLIALISWVLIIRERNYDLNYLLAVPLAKELVILLLLSTISLIYTPNLSYGFRYWSMILQVLLSYLMLYESIDSKELLLKFQQTLLIAPLVVALYAIYEYLIGVNTSRAVSFFGNPNYLSVYLLIFIPLALGLVTELSLSKAKRGFAGVIFLACSTALLLTMSRGAWLGTTIALVLFTILKDKRFLVLVLIIALMIPFIVSEDIINRVKTITSIESNMDRVNLWNTTIEMIKDHPILGLGIGGFRPVYAEYGPGDWKADSHNIFLQFIVELGILGLLFIIYFLYLLSKIALTILKRYDFNKKGGGLALGTVIALLALFINLQFDFQLSDRPIAMLTLFLIANLTFLAGDCSPT